MSHKIELSNGRVTYCNTINPIALNQIEKKFGCKIKSIAGNEIAKEGKLIEGSDYVSNMEQLDKEPMFIFSIYTRLSDPIKTKSKAYPTGIRYKKTTNVNLLEYITPNKYTPNISPFNWVDKNGRKFYETLGDSSSKGDFYANNKSDSYFTHYYFFPKKDWTLNQAQQIATINDPIKMDFKLVKHPSLYAFGNQIPDHYIGMEGMNVWNNWNESQRKHFLHDHFTGYAENYEYVPVEYSELPQKIKEEVDYHVTMGQYSKGGKMYKKGGSTKKLNSKELAESNEYDLDEHEIDFLDTHGNLVIHDGNKEICFYCKDNGDYEMIMDDEYCKVYESLEDMLEDTNCKAEYEKDHNLSEKMNCEIYTDKMGNMKKLEEGGVSLDYFAKEIGIEGTTIDKAEKGKKLGFTFNVGDLVQINENNFYYKVLKGFDTKKPFIIIDRKKTKLKDQGDTGYYYTLKSSNNHFLKSVPQGLLTLVEKFASGGTTGEYKIGDEVKFFNTYDKSDKVGVITEKLTNDRFAISSGFTTSLVELKDIKGKTKIREKSDKFLGIFEKGGSTEIGEIKKYKDALIKKAKTKGIYENFGQKEVRLLEDKYGYTNQVADFDNWAMNFDLSQLEKYAEGGQTDKEDIKKLENSLMLAEKEYRKAVQSEKVGIISEEQLKRKKEKVDSLRDKINVWYSTRPIQVRPNEKYAEGGIIEKFSVWQSHKEETFQWSVVIEGERITGTLEINKFSSNYDTEPKVWIQDFDYVSSSVKSKQLFEKHKDEILDFLINEIGKQFIFSKGQKFAEGGQTDLFDEEISEMVDETPDFTETKYRVEIGGINEDYWSTNSVEFDSEFDAKKNLDALSSRFFGYDVSRVVPVSTPKGQKIEPDSKGLYQNFGRFKKMGKGGNVKFPIWRSQKFEKGGLKEDNTKYPRKSDDTGKGIMQGWVVGDAYYETEEGALHAVKDLGYKTIEDAYENNDIYFTDWHDEDLEEQGYYYTSDGKEIEISANDNVENDLKSEKGTKTGKGFMVFNYTDDIYASPEIFKTKKEANEFIADFRKRYEKQGYYRDNQWNKILPKDIDLLAIPEDFNPFPFKSK